MRVPVHLATVAVVALLAYALGVDSHSAFLTGLLSGSLAQLAVIVWWRRTRPDSA